jgi:ribosome-associated heat shock protein Hsp15
LAGPSAKPNSSSAISAPQKLRLDKWLFVARFFKSREIAHSVVAEGHVRVNGQPCGKPAHGVAAGDVLTFVQGGRVRLIRIAALGAKRGPASDAALLYVDLDAGRTTAPDQA